MNLAQKIQKHRKLRGLTQEELAEALDVSHQSISKWESGQTMPGLDKVLLLSDFFQVSTDYLLKGDCEAGDTAPPVPEQQLPQKVELIPQQPVPHPARKPRLFYYLGVCATLAGCSGIVLVWIFSLLYPPYTLGKSLNPVAMFSFFIRYNEMETHLTLLGATALIGAGILLFCKFVRNAND